MRRRVRKETQERTERNETKKSCGNIFAALKLDMTEEALKFCRRLGEKGEDPRPLLASFHTEMENSKLLRNARNLEKTAFKT